MSNTHPLHQYEQEIEYLHSVVSTQSDPSRYNALSLPIEARIKAITIWLEKDGDTSTSADIEYAFALLEEYINIWRIYFKNHPWRPLYDSK